MSVRAARAGMLAILAAIHLAGSELDSAVAALRQGNPEPISKLRLAPDQTAEAARFLSDAEEAVRREVTHLLARTGGAGGCSAIVKSLTDASADLRERAANLILQHCARETTAGIEGLAGALRQSILRGSSSAAAVLLLARFPGPETLSFLQDRFHDATRVKLAPWSHPVSLGLAASAAAASLGDANGRSRIAAAADLAEAEFLTEAIREIQDPATLRELLRLLEDRREIAAGVPSGAQPRRRLCDAAVDAFAARLQLNPFTPRPGGRYSDPEIARVKEQAQQALAR